MWAQVTRFLVTVDKELNQTHRVYSRERADSLSDSTLHRTWEQANSEQRLTSGGGGFLFLQGSYFLASFGGLLLYMYKYLYYFKATAHVVSHDFPWLAAGTMLVYYNGIIMKQGSCSIFCTGAFMSHHDSVLFQRAGATHLRTGSLSCIDVLHLSPGAPTEFPPPWLSPASYWHLFCGPARCHGKCSVCTWNKYILLLDEMY